MWGLVVQLRQSVGSVGTGGAVEEGCRECGDGNGLAKELKTCWL